MRVQTSVIFEPLFGCFKITVIDEFRNTQILWKSFAQVIEFWIKWKGDGLDTCPIQEDLEEILEDYKDVMPIEAKQVVVQRILQIVMDKEAIMRTKTFKEFKNVASLVQEKTAGIHCFKADKQMSLNDFCVRISSLSFLTHLSLTMYSTFALEVGKCFKQIAHLKSKQIASSLKCFAPECLGQVCLC
jgi:hypothetical protein